MERARGVPVRRARRCNALHPYVYSSPRTKASRCSRADAVGALQLTHGQAEKGGHDEGGQTDAACKCRVRLRRHIVDVLRLGAAALSACLFVPL